MTFIMYAKGIDGYMSHTHTRELEQPTVLSNYIVYSQMQVQVSYCKNYASTGEKPHLVESERLLPAARVAVKTLHLLIGLEKGRPDAHTFEWTPHCCFIYNPCINAASPTAWGQTVIIVLWPNDVARHRMCLLCHSCTAEHGSQESEGYCEVLSLPKMQNRSFHLSSLDQFFSRWSIMSLFLLLQLPKPEQPAH